ncbi:hypothetical protein F5X71_14670 [Nocardia brasiliensis]|uniref:Uncharacterized protein n=1 Tax=Nocardia brasiliensis TaxID=37326 RepID=A0A6G9XR59_NOCBR|nr:hypothetical protein [Nocardia brasiliensis]QIS03398.1 hypothetical protein F5X71_14670 [Nocardia brasiliensis]
MGEEEFAPRFRVMPGLGVRFAFDTGDARGASQGVSRLSLSRVLNSRSPSCLSDRHCEASPMQRTVSNVEIQGMNPENASETGSNTTDRIEHTPIGISTTQGLVAASTANRRHSASRAIIFREPVPARREARTQCSQLIRIGSNLA